ncbi:MAG: chemotaxis protein CheB [Mucilaginibacter polytrichastri]|nr:chemotaxis protein CheB [Mucilaginibacter polytrichastri]
MNESPSANTEDAPLSITESSHASFPVIVMGASTGGLPVLRSIVKELPEDLGAAVLIVWHMPAQAEGMLPYILNKEGKLPAANAGNLEPLLPNRVYVAPPDHHMVIERGHILLTHGPKENRFRPAIDPMFRSAAFYYQSSVIGVILSGALDDGTAGLWTIKQYGGTAIVQDPMEAEASSMPESAIREVDVDHMVPTAKMAALLTRLVNKKKSEKRQLMPTDKLTGIELNIAKGGSGFKEGIMKMGDLTPYTCPECHGVLVNIKEGNLSRYRCHTGHAFTAAALLSAITETIEDNIYSAVRGIEESILLLNHMGDHYAEANEPRLAAAYFQKAKEAMARAEEVRAAALHHENLSVENLRIEAGETK